MRQGLGPDGALIAERLEAAGALPVTADNELTYYTAGQPFYDALFAALAQAKRTIVIQFFVIDSDTVGNRLLDILAERARAGVEVYLVTDGLSSGWIAGRHGRKQELEAAGAHVGLFLPLKKVILSPRKNDRDHRKIAVVDADIGFVCGLNVADRYLGGSKMFGGKWRDAGCRCAGSAVDSLTLTVFRHWRYITGEDLTQAPRFYRTAPGPGHAAVQITTGGADRPHFNSAREQYCAVADAARSQLYLTSPFFVPSRRLRRILARKAEEGVDVRVIISHGPLIGLVNRHYAGWLVARGVRVYEYSAGFCHAKTMVGDRRWGVVGSTNIDARSGQLNFECSLLAYDRAFGEDMAAAFERDLAADCTAYTLEVHRARGLGTRLKTALALTLASEM